MKPKYQPKKTTIPDPDAVVVPKAPSKKSHMIDLLQRLEGVSIDELEKTLGWQKHSVRGALVHLKNKDKHPVTSTVEDGIRRYRIVKMEDAQ